MYDLILVSQSPRRAQLLSEAGFSFQIDPVKLSETLEKNLSLTDAVQHLAQQKVEAYCHDHKYLNSHNFLALGADTVVALGQTVMGKPQDPDQARLFLRQLSGNTHRVLTGVFVYNFATGFGRGFTDETAVTFRNLAEEEIESYILSGEPFDKAGGYAIQGMGRDFVIRFDGAFDTVVGLPVERLTQLFAKEGWHVRRR